MKVSLWVPEFGDLPPELLMEKKPGELKPGKVLAEYGPYLENDFRAGILTNRVQLAWRLAAPVIVTASKAEASAIDFGALGVCMWIPLARKTHSPV